MASSLKIKTIAGVWCAGLSISGVYTFKYLRQFEERAPCVREAIAVTAANPRASAILGDNAPESLRVLWWTGRGSIDKMHGRAHSRFQLQGPQGTAEMVVGARKQQKFISPGVLDLGADEDDLDVGILSYYWTRPWELKFAFLNKLRWLQGQEPLKVTIAAPNDEIPWELDILFMVPSAGSGVGALPLMGDPRSLPEFEELLRMDASAKGDSSRRQLRIFGGMCMAAALCAAGLRISRSLAVSRGFGHSKRAILAHPRVVGLLGNGVTVQSSSGTFGNTYVNARLRLVNQQGSLGEVDFAAVRDSSRDKWQVLIARLRTGGRSHELERNLL